MVLTMVNPNIHYGTNGSIIDPNSQFAPSDVPVWSPSSPQRVSSHRRSAVAAGPFRKRNPWTLWSWTSWTYHWNFLEFLWLHSMVDIFIEFPDQQKLVSHRDHGHAFRKWLAMLCVGDGESWLMMGNDGTWWVMIKFMGSATIHANGFNMLPISINCGAPPHLGIVKPVIWGTRHDSTPICLQGNTCLLISGIALSETINVAIAESGYQPWLSSTAAHHNIKHFQADGFTKKVWPLATCKNPYIGLYETTYDMKHQSHQ